MEPLDEATRTTIRADLRAGRKIAAIASYRNATGAGLAKAKADVEAIAAENGIPVATIAPDPKAIALVLFVAAVAFLVARVLAPH